MDRLGSKQFAKTLKLAMEGGIPTSIRGEIWKAVVANDLAITRPLFEVYKMQARRLHPDSPPASSASSSASASPAPTSLQQQHQQGASVMASCYTNVDGSKIGKYASFNYIARDMFRTFDELKFFHDDPQWRSDVRNILESFVLYRCVRECVRACVSG